MVGWGWVGVVTTGWGLLMVGWGMSHGGIGGRGDD